MLYIVCFNKSSFDAFIRLVYVLSDPKITQLYNMRSLFQDVALSLSHVQMLSDASTADNIWTHCDKKRNCIQWVIFLLPQHCQLCLISILIFIDIFQYFCQDVFKFVCCRFVVCWKELNDNRSTKTNLMPFATNVV